MSAEAPGLIVNGGSAATKSPAAILEEQHARDEAHKATVEEVPDEDDIQHPPPSSLEKDVKSDSASGSAATPARTGAPTPAPAQKKAPAFDVKSEELFPALGGGPKPRTAAVPTAWGAKKPSAASAPNGQPNGSQASSRSASRISILDLKLTMLGSTAAAGAQAFSSNDVPKIMTLPGKHVEQLRLAPSQMLPRGQLKKPLRDLLRDISKRSKATVDMRSGPGGSIIFEGKGSADAVRQALKDVAQQVGSKVCHAMVPLL